MLLRTDEVRIMAPRLEAYAWGRDQDTDTTRHAPLSNEQRATSNVHYDCDHDECPPQQPANAEPPHERALFH